MKPHDLPGFDLLWKRAEAMKFLTRNRGLAVNWGTKTIIKTTSGNEKLGKLRLYGLL
jgi:hypothetical protein